MAKTTRGTATTDYGPVGPPLASEPVLRADARRNYDRLLAAGRDAFAEHGTDASLRDVARRAGVGIGTLYRHFPTREALLEALVRDSFDRRRARAEELLGSSSPGDALTIWLGEFIAGAARFHGLTASVMSALSDEESELHSACDAMRDAGARLLARAQRSGGVRPDVTAEELFALAAGVAWVGEQIPARPGLPDRLLSLVMTGLETGEPAPDAG